MKILFLSDSYMKDGSFDPFRKEVLQALSCYGHETKAIITNHFWQNNSSDVRIFKNVKRILDIIRRFNPNLVFSINRAGLVKAVTDVISPNSIIITWFIDSYERVPEYLLQFSSKDIVWLTGLREYADNFSRKYGLDKDKIVFAPFATNTSIFFPNNHTRDVDICLVGTAFCNEAFVQELNEIATDIDSREALISVFESHKQNYIFDIGKSLQGKGYKKYKEKQREVWQMIFDDQISIEKRIKFIAALKEFNVKIYGEPNYLWIKYLSIYESSMLSKFQFAPIKTPQELSDFYNISKIGINISHHQASNHSLPIRPFDLMACKTLLVTEKNSKEALEYIGFVENVDFVCFENIKDLKDKCDFYLKNDVEREKVVESAYAKIKEFHSLKVRMEQGMAKSLGENVTAEDLSNQEVEIISSYNLVKRISLTKRYKYLQSMKDKFPKIWELFRFIAIRLKVLH